MEIREIETDLTFFESARHVLTGTIQIQAAAIASVATAVFAWSATILPALTPEGLYNLGWISQYTQHAIELHSLYTPTMIPIIICAGMLNLLVMKNIFQHAIIPCAKEAFDNLRDGFCATHKNIAIKSQ